MNQKSSFVIKVLDKLRSLNESLQSFVAITEKYINAQTNEYFYDHAKEHNARLLNLQILSVLQIENIELAQNIRESLQVVTGETSSLFDKYWIDESDPHYEDLGDESLNRKKNWTGTSKIRYVKNLAQNTKLLFKKTLEEQQTFLSNIDEHTLNIFTTECDKIKTFIDTANIEIPRKYWRGEINQLTNSISGLQRFIMRFQNEWCKCNTWINGEIQKRTLPEIHYVCEVFGLNNTNISTTDKLLKLMEITDETINKPAYELHTRVDEMKLMFCKIVQLCSDIQNDYIEIDLSTFDKRLIEVHSLQANNTWLTQIVDKETALREKLKSLKGEYNLETASQANEFLSEIRIAIAIAKAKPGSNVECDYTTPESDIGKTDVDFKLDTEAGSILIEITGPRKSDFIKDHTFYEAHNSGELGITLSKSAYKEFPEYIKAKNVILNKCQKNGVPIKFPKLSKETLNVIVVFENSALGYLDHHDYIEVFLSSNSKNPGLLFGIDDATKIFQKRIDCVCFIKNFNEVFILYNPWVKNKKLQEDLRSILREVGTVKVISIQDLLIKFAHCVPSKREQLCLTQQQLADLCRVERTFIENIECGDETNNFHSFFRVLQMLRIDLNTIKD